MEDIPNLPNELTPPPPAAERRPRATLANVVLLLVAVLILSILGIVLLKEPQRVLMFLVLAGEGLIPVFAPLVLGRWGRKRGWPPSRTRIIAISFVVLWLGVLATLMTSAFLKVRESSKLKAMLPRQIGAGVDQFFLENSDRIFLNYEELVGPQCYISAYHSVDGEDLSVQFPLRRGWIDRIPVRLPDGSTVLRHEVIAAIGQSGLIATYPLPQENLHDRNRVYRLDCGVSLRGNRVVNLPPDPAGREGRDQDGVHTYSLPDGRRFEINYHGGVPDGPFRAFYLNGALWGEATYRQGKVIEAWLISRRGKRFDELHDGPAASAAVTAEAVAEAEQHASLGRQKLSAKDFKEAIAEFTAAIACYEFHGPSYFSRAEAQLALGDSGGASQDFRQARDFAESDTERRLAEQRLRALQQSGK